MFNSASNRNEYHEYFLGVSRADSLTTFMCRLSWNLEASVSWNPQDLSRSVMGLLYLLKLLCSTEWGHRIISWAQVAKALSYQFGKAPDGFVVFVRPLVSARLRLDEFSEVWCLGGGEGLLRKSAYQLQISLKSAKNLGHFTRLAKCVSYCR
jgi:hypothetical protein